MSHYHFTRPALPARSPCASLLTAVLYGVLSPAASAVTTTSPAVEHSIVSYDPSRFQGWPANEGMWAWGDEILVGYITGSYLSNEKGHSIDPKGGTNLAFARSLDGGKTWAVESERPAIAFSKPPGTPATNQTEVDFESETFAMKMRYNNFHLSSDRGHSWQGPFRFSFDSIDGEIITRTSYIPTGKHSALVFGTTMPSPHNIARERGHSFVAQTIDGGRTYEFLSWIGSDLMEGLAEEADYPVHSIMPNAVLLRDGRLLCALRQRIDRRKWTDIYASDDGGRSWRLLSELESGSSNPASLVVLPDGRLAAIYGWRGQGYGLRAKISDDNAESWSEEIILRNDATGRDIGYPQAKALPDGTVLIVYYYSTAEHPEQHIAATRWKP